MKLEVFCYNLVMNNIEKFQSYKLRDGEEIGGILNRVAGNTSIVVFVHGLSGNPSEPAFYAAKRLFPTKGYDTLRLFLYSHDMRSNRFAWNTSLQQHREDLEDVIKKLEKKYKKIFIVAHSIGGPVVYQSQYVNDCEKVYAVALWEPTIKPVSVKEDFKLNRALNRYVSYNIVVSKKFVDEISKLNTKSIEVFVKPFLLVLDTKGQLKKNWKEAERYIKAPYNKFLAKNSGHDFSAGDSVDQVLTETLNYFDKH